MKPISTVEVRTTLKRGLGRILASIEDKDGVGGTGYVATHFDILGTIADSRRVCVFIEEIRRMPAEDLDEAEAAVKHALRRIPQGVQIVAVYVEY